MSKDNLISYGEWMAELERLHNTQPEARGLTMRELVKQYGKSDRWISLHLLRPAAEEGRLLTFKRKQVDLAGRDHWVTEYALRSVPHEEDKAG